MKWISILLVVASVLVVAVISKCAINKFWKWCTKTIETLQMDRDIRFIRKILGYESYIERDFKLPDFKKLLIHIGVLDREEIGIIWTNVRELRIMMRKRKSLPKRAYVRVCYFPNDTVKGGYWGEVDYVDFLLSGVPGEGKYEESKWRFDSKFDDELNRLEFVVGMHHGLYYRFTTITAPQDSGWEYCCDSELNQVLDILKFPSIHCYALEKICENVAIILKDSKKAVGHVKSLYAARIVLENPMGFIEESPDGHIDIDRICSTKLRQGLQQQKIRNITRKFRNRRDNAS